MPKFTYMLAPLEDMTDAAFRTLCHRHGADITFTELARIDPLAKGVKNTTARLVITDSTPTVVQLLGDNEQFLKKFLSSYRPAPGFMGFNLNLGCPNPTAIRQGHGAAMVARISKTKKMASIIRDHGYPISIKLRLGMTRNDKENRTYLKLIDAVDADFYVVHARFAGQSYIEPADFSVYPELVATGKKIVANGDIITREQADSLQSQGLSGVMIGRAAIADPAIFQRLKGIPAPAVDQLREEYLTLAKAYGTEFRYQKNILKWLGSSAHIDQE